jgi:protein SCO1
MKSLLCLLLMIVCGARADTSYPPTSIYNLPAKLSNQAGTSHGLDVHQGHPVLITLFYGSCPLACPLLIDTLRSIERAAPEQRSQLRVLLISVDPERDTTDALAALARARSLDTARWTLARTEPATVRKIAALLNIQYRRQPNGDYNHASVISLLNSRGEVVVQSSMLGKADPKLLEAIRQAAPRM